MEFLRAIRCGEPSDLFLPSGVVSPVIWENMQEEAGLATSGTKHQETPPAGEEGTWDSSLLVPRAWLLL